MTDARGRDDAILDGRYRLLRQLGAGGAGEVYEAEHVGLGVRRALKVLRRDAASREALARFREEAVATARCRHPNIVEVYDVGEDASRSVVYLAQEILRGPDLRAHLARTGPLAPAAALEIVVPVMGALVAAHRLGVIHRDVKPENIVLHQTGPAAFVPKLVDFGIARFLRDAPPRRRRTTRGWLGTAAYMPPEQVLAPGTVDARADVWAVGAVLYELLAGRGPYDDAGASDLDVLRAVVDRAPPDLSRVAPGTPPALAAVVRRALARDRDARFPTMQAFLGALLDCPLDAPAPAPAAPRDEDLPRTAVRWRSPRGPGVVARALLRRCDASWCAWMLWAAALACVWARLFGPAPAR